MMTEEEIVWSTAVVILRNTGRGSIRYDLNFREYIWVDYSLSPFGCKIWARDF